MTDATAFLGFDRLASGPLPEVAAAVHRALDVDPEARALVFDDADGRVIDLDLRGTPDEVRARHAPVRARGRPRLGVSAREVTLLPRHWDWLSRQRGGASATLRGLVDAAIEGDREAPRRARQEAAYRFMQALAGDLPGFEEAARALFADDAEGLAARLAAWPADVHGYAWRLAHPEAEPSRG